MRVSIEGAAVGAVCCGISRSLVVAWAIQTPALLLMLPSAAIGLLVGAIAGAIGRPVISAVTGAFLSAFILELFLLPCVSVIGTFGEITGNANADEEFVQATLKYLFGMGLAGAIGGGVGGVVGQRQLRRRDNADEGVT